MEIKIAYLILCHRNPNQVAQLINKLYIKEQTFFFIHIDKPSYSKKFKNEIFSNVKDSNVIFFSSDQVNVKWGGMSFLKAIEILLREAFTFNNSFDYYSLLSVQDYPVKTNNQIINFLTKNKGKSFIEVSPYSINNSVSNRLNRLYFYDLYSKKYDTISIRNLFFRSLTKALGYRNVPFIPYWGRVWWILWKDHVEYILKSINEKSVIYSHMKYTLLPEEIFFASTLGNSPFINNIISKRTTFADYSEPHPRLITTSEIKNLVKSDFLFARKFSHNSQTIKELNKLI